MSPAPPPRRGRAAVGMTAATTLLAVSVGLTGCANRDPEPVAPAPTSSTSAASAVKPKTSATSTTAAPLPGMPAVKSTQPSSVDSSQLHSAADLASAFGCPTAVSPITIPASTAGATPTATVVPVSVVCASRLADDEALYLWYVATPEEKLAAVKAAMAQTKYVRAGANWVAGGTISPTMGTVGGEVYK